MGSSKKPAKYKTLNSEDYALEIERELLRIIKNVERKIARDKRTATNKVALKKKGSKNESTQEGRLEKEAYQKIGNLWLLDQ